MIPLAIFLMITFNCVLLADCDCSSDDRQYDCDCLLEPNNRTVLFENEEHYNISTENFLPVIKTLQYCQGSFFCKPNFKPIPPSEVINTRASMICFGDDTCLFNGATEIATLQGWSSMCVKSTCMYLKDLVKFNITNEFLQVGTYTCIKVGPKGLKAPYCLKPACKSFVATEKLCVCHQKVNNCSCSSYCEKLRTSPSHKIYALFLSFGDIYITEGAKTSYFHWIVVMVLSVGLTLLLLIFCKLCEKAMDPSMCGNQAQNTETIRRILAANFDPPIPSTSTSPKENNPATIRGDQGSPPPTYEQVLKDKCIEFKKSVV